MAGKAGLRRDARSATLAPMTRLAPLIALMLMLTLAALPARAEALRVFAAASLGEALADLGAAWESAGHAPLVASHAGTATLARQIAAGAPADVFLSADAVWMGWAEEAGAIMPHSARVFASNRLVIAARAGDPAPLALTPAALVARLGPNGRLAMGLPGAVPAGTYGRAALEALGMWQAAAPRVAGTDSVRAALALVSLGAAPLGVVYATDLNADPRVAEVARLPATSHPPITYHAGAVTARGAAFVAFVTSAAGQAILARHGFGPPPGR